MCKFSGKSPLSSHKTTLKQQINGQKRWQIKEKDLSCFGWVFAAWSVLGRLSSIPSSLSSSLSQSYACFLLSFTACNTAAGDRCLPKAFNCTTSSGTCGDGEQCCVAPTGQCNEIGIKIQCVPPDVCISLVGGNVHADLTCYDSPPDDVCCYMEV